MGPHIDLANRKAVYSVTEVAHLCTLSRARFYDLIRDGVMPYPVYCVRTKKPMYFAEMAVICQRVRRSNVGIDGRYVIFYDRRPAAPETTPSRKTPAASRPASDPLRQEMVETLRAMGVRTTDDEIAALILQQCPQGVRERTFETDLRAVFDLCRCRNAG